MKKLLLIIFSMTLVVTPYTFSATAENTAAKRSLAAGGWIIKTPVGWEIWQDKTLNAVICAPKHAAYDSGSNKDVIFIYLAPRPWPYSKLADAIPELKQKPTNSEIELRTLNGREWLLNRAKNDKETMFFARAMKQPQQYFNIRADGEKTKQALLELIGGLSLP